MLRTNAIKIITSNLKINSANFHSESRIKQPMTKEELIESLKTKIDSLVNEKPLVLFMKGTATAPLCGFSQYVVNAIGVYKIKKIQTVDVTLNSAISSALKQYSKWPTIPQLFIKGKLIGGYDIIKEMHMDGSLEKLLKDNNLLEQDTSEGSETLVKNNKN